LQSEQDDCTPAVVGPMFAYLQVACVGSDLLQLTPDFISTHASVAKRLDLSYNKLRFVGLCGVCANEHTPNMDIYSLGVWLYSSRLPCTSHRRH
jgi:hypothetical protein